MSSVKTYGTKYGFLSASTLKLIACAAMFFDHLGFMLFPEVIWLRAIGRLAFPIFAYFIAEGCRYTRNKLKHFSLVFALGVVYFLFYLVVYETVYPSIFLTFSFSILNIYLLDELKKFAFNDRDDKGRVRIWRVLCAVLCALTALSLTYIPFSLVVFDYGYIGMLAPVLISLFDFKSVNAPSAIKRLDCYYVRLAFLAICCILLALKNQQITFSLFGNAVTVQVFNLLAVLLLMLYDGSAGNKKLKYFFYAFYPLHLGLIMLIGIIVDWILWS